MRWIGSGEGDEEGELGTRLDSNVRDDVVKMN